MPLDDFKLQDYLLPDQETMDEFDLFEEEDVEFGHEIQAASIHRPQRGFFSDAPDRAALWMEQVSEHYKAA